MDVLIQLFSIILSFVYGIFLTCAFYGHFMVIRRLNIYWKSFLSVLFSLDSIMLYIYLLYVLNEGFIHLYFFFALVLGSFFTFFCHKNVKLLKKLLPFLKK